MNSFKNIFILLLCSVTSFCFAQKEDRNWVFGDSIRIDFNNLSNPTVHHANCYNDESNASISKRNGTLISYINTLNYWGGENRYCQLMNKQNVMMENGDSINHYYSSSDGALFLPMPEDTDKYYFFSMSGSLALQGFLSYSIIDKSYNGGLGKVISKNNILEDSLIESMVATRHANGRDWWLLVHKQFSNRFVKFLISPSGISSPIYQSIGSIFYIVFGESAISEVGNRLVWVSIDNNLDAFDFDRCNGELSSWVELGTPPYYQGDPLGQTYGCEISPDGSRLYVSRTLFTPTKAVIFQYSLNATSIINSKTEILSPTDVLAFAQLELGPDDRIYLAGTFGVTTLDSCLYYLSSIDNPNDSATACNLHLYSLFLNGRYPIYGLPNIPHYNLSALDGSACDTLGIDAPNNIEVIRKSILNIYPNPATNELTIEILNGIAPKQIEITNSLGVTVMQLHQTKPNQQLNISQLPSGVYFVKIKMQDGSVTVRRFVKL